MTSLLLCGGFGRFSIIVIFPIFFSLGEQWHLISISVFSMKLLSTFCAGTYGCANTRLLFNRSPNARNN